MSDPVIPPTPAPVPVVDWDSGRRFRKSIWAWAVSFGEVRVGGAAKGTAATIWAVLSWIWKPATVLLVWVTCLYGLAYMGAIQLPLPNPAPAPQPSALEQQIHTAYLAETDPAKAANAAKLASILTGVVPAAKASGNVKTVADVDTVLASATANAGLKGTLPIVGKAVGDYLNSKLPTVKTTAMTDALWTQIGTEFASVADALKKGAK